MRQQSESFLKKIILLWFHIYYLKAMWVEFNTHSLDEKKADGLASA